MGCAQVPSMFPSLAGKVEVLSADFCLTSHAAAVPCQVVESGTP